MDKISCTSHLPCPACQLWLFCLAEVDLSCSQLSQISGTMTTETGSFKESAGLWCACKHDDCSETWAGLASCVFLLITSCLFTGHPLDDKISQYGTCFLKCKRMGVGVLSTPVPNASALHNLQLRFLLDSFDSITLLKHTQLKTIL